MALPLIAVCGLGWGLQRFGKKLHSDGRDIDEATCSSVCGCGSGDSDCSSGEGRSFWASLLSMISNLAPILLLGLLAGCGVGPDRQRANRTIDGWRRMGLCRRGRGRHTGLCLRRRRSPPYGGARHDGRGNWSAFTFMQASVGTCLPTLMMLPKLIGVKLTVAYLVFWLVYSVGERDPRGMDSVI